MIDSVFHDIIIVEKKNIYNISTANQNIFQDECL